MDGLDVAAGEGPWHLTLPAIEAMEISLSCWEKLSATEGFSGWSGLGRRCWAVSWAGDQHSREGAAAHGSCSSGTFSTFWQFLEWKKEKKIERLKVFHKAAGWVNKVLLVVLLFPSGFGCWVACVFFQNNLSLNFYHFSHSWLAFSHDEKWKSLYWQLSEAGRGITWELLLAVSSPAFFTCSHPALATAGTHHWLKGYSENLGHSFLLNFFFSK